MADNELFGGAEPSWRMTVGAELLLIEEHCARAARAQAETVKIWRVTIMCPGLYGYRLSTAYTSSPRAMTKPSSSDIFGMSVNGCPVDFESGVAASAM